MLRLRFIISDLDLFGVKVCVTCFCYVVVLGQEVEGLDHSCGWCREPLQLGRIHWPWGKGQHTATCSSWQPPRHLATGLLYIEYISINNIGTHEERNTEKKACKGEGNHYRSTKCKCRKAWNQNYSKHAAERISNW